MNLSMEQLLDYMQCPLLYKFRHIDKLDVSHTGGNNAVPKVNTHSLRHAFDQELHKLGYHIFNYVQDGRYPSLYLLRQKWGKLWCKDKTKQDVMWEATTLDAMTPHKRFEKIGLKAIEKMHPKFKENPGIPLLVGKQVTFPIGRHTLTVVIDLVREVIYEEKTCFEILDFQTGIKTKSKTDVKPLSLHIHRDLSVTAQSAAFRHLTGEKEGQIIYYDMINDKEYPTTRDDEDYKTLESVLDHVEVAIHHQVSYPVMNDRCFDCAYQYACRKSSWYV